MAELKTPREVSSTRPADLRALARGSAWNLAGSFVAALVHLALPIIITRRLSTDEAGAFFATTTLFAMLMSVGTLGADTGVLWALPRAKSLERRSEIPALLRLSLGTVIAVTTVVAGFVVLLAPKLAGVLVRGPGPMRGDFESLVYIQAPFLPIVAVYVIACSASRGLGSIKPLVFIDKLGRNALQTALVGFCLLVTPSLLLAVVAWYAPYLAALTVISITVLRLVRNSRPEAPSSAAPRPRRQISRELWSFTGPRALANIFAVALRRVDVLLVSAISGLGQAAVYAAASRFVLLGLMFVQAIQQVMAPRISEFLAKGDVQRAQVIYATTTAWLMLISWPIYLTSAIFAPFLLSVFGAGYSSGAAVVVILCLSMLIATSCGPVDTVLLMGGRSRWSLLNTGLALTVNVGVDLLLIPRYGIEGAAVGWAVGIALNNLPPLYQVHRFLAMHPFGAGTSRAAVITVTCFGGWGLLSRTLLGATAVGFLTAGLLGGLSYLLCLRHQQAALDLDALVSVVRRRRRK